MELKGPLPHPQEATTRPCPETDQSSPCPPSNFMKIHCNIILPSMPGIFPSGPPIKTYAPLLSPIHATCSAHPFICDLITRIIFGED
jgi:hypothetical protein